MPSPFPGMNPYLEQDDVWHDFHQSFIPQAREMIGAQVGPEYLVKVEEQLFIHELSSGERRLLGRADVAVAGPHATAEARPAVAVTEAPAYGLLPDAVDVERHSYLEIRDRRDRALITVVELLSPSNKRPGADRAQYLAQRRHLVARGVHLIELDLLRGGPRLPLEGLPACDYCAVVVRAEEWPRVALWPLRLRDPLPAIPIPLRAPDPDAHLDLQAALHRVYDAARYAHYIYAGTPQPPLLPDDSAWARSFLPAGA